MTVNQELFTAWHSHHYGRLLGTMQSMVRDRLVAEDVTSTALAIAWRNLDRFRGEASLYTWIYRIARNEALRQLSQRRTVSLDALKRPLPERAESSDAGGTSDHIASLARLKKAVRTLPALHRDVLIDHFIRRQSVKRIACRRGIPVGTVLSRLFKAKRLLRAAWGL